MTGDALTLECTHCGALYIAGTTLCADCLGTQFRPTTVPIAVPSTFKTGAPTRVDFAFAVRDRIEPQYWPFAVFVYPVLGFLTLGIGLWIVWARQEGIVSGKSAGWWLRPLGFVLLIFLPFGYIFVASSYGRNLYYLSRPAAAPEREHLAQITNHA